MVKCSKCIGSRDNCTECSHMTRRNSSDSCKCIERYYDNNTAACGSKIKLTYNMVFFLFKQYNFNKNRL